MTASAQESLTNCFKNKTFTLTANGRYHSVTAGFDADELPAGFSPETMGLNGTHVTAQLGLSATARAGCSVRR